MDTPILDALIAELVLLRDGEKEEPAKEETTLPRELSQVSIGEVKDVKQQTISKDNLAPEGSTILETVKEIIDGEGGITVETI